MRSQKKEKQGQNVMHNQKKAEKSPGEKIKETSSAGRTQKDADDTENVRNFRKTSQKLCKSCKYHVIISAGMHYIACYYIVRTQQSLDCPIGWCDKYQKGKAGPEEWNRGKM